MSAPDDEEDLQQLEIIADAEMPPGCCAYALSVLNALPRMSIADDPLLTVTLKDDCHGSQVSQAVRPANSRRGVQFSRRVM